MVTGVLHIDLGTSPIALTSLKEFESFFKKKIKSLSSEVGRLDIYYIVFYNHFQEYLLNCQQLHC